MTNIKKTEEKVYEAVIRCELEIDSMGRIWRIGKRGWDRWKKEVVTKSCKRVRAEHRLPLGYLQIRAMIDGVRYNGLAHRLVWFHVNGSIPDGFVINHKNGIKDDNRPSNLEIVSPSDNAKHAANELRVGRCANQSGEMNHNAKLNSDQVREIRKRRQDGESLNEIANDYGVAFQTISKIITGKSWKHVE